MTGDDDRSEVVDRESQMDFDEPSPGRNSSLVFSHLNVGSVTSMMICKFLWTTGPLLSYALEKPAKSCKITAKHGTVLRLPRR